MVWLRRLAGHRRQSSIYYSYLLFPGMAALSPQDDYPYPNYLGASSRVIALGN